MKILNSPNFEKELNNIVDFISQDSENRAVDFLYKLKDKIDNLTFSPYKFRESIYYNNEQIRDLIFKGYTIPYFINEEDDLILILDIIKYREISQKG